MKRTKPRTHQEKTFKIEEQNIANYYAVIPANVRYDKKLIPNAKLLYGEITALSNQQGFCWATNGYFAKLYNVSKISISTWIRALSENGYISITMQYKKGTNQIENRILNISPIKENLHTPIKENLHTPIKENLKDNNININNTSYNKSKPKEIIFERKKKQILQDFYFDYSFFKDDFAKIWFSEFLPLKKRKKAAVTNRALESQLKHVAQYAHNDYKTALEILEKSVNGGWSDLYPLNGNKKNSTNTNGSRAYTDNDIDYSGVKVTIHQ